MDTPPEPPPARPVAEAGTRPLPAWLRHLRQEELHMWSAAEEHATRKMKLHLVCICVGMGMCLLVSFTSGWLIHIVLPMSLTPSALQEMGDYISKL